MKGFPMKTPLAALRSRATQTPPEEHSVDDVLPQKARNAAAAPLRTSAALSFDDWAEYLVAAADRSESVYRPLTVKVPGEKIVVSEQANGWLVRGTEDPKIGPMVDKTSGKRLPRTNIISFRGLKNKSNSNLHCPAIRLYFVIKRLISKFTHLISKSSD